LTYSAVNDRKIYSYFLDNNVDRKLNIQVLNSLSERGLISISEITGYKETLDHKLSPLTSFINNLETILTCEDKQYFQEIFASSYIKDKMAEYCLENSIEYFLSEYFSQRQLSDLLKKLGRQTIPRKKEEIIKDLVKFNFQSYQESKGIYYTLRKVNDLINLFSKNRGFIEAHGIVTNILTEAEKVTRELILFYAAMFFGDENYLIRLREPYDGKPILETYDISRLTFGGMEQTLRRFDRRLEIDEKLQQTCLEYFARTSILNIKAYRFLGEIIPLRNYIIHPSPRESDESSEPIFKIYEKVIKNVKEYLELLSQRELKIYPEVISIESFVHNHYGIKYWLCNMDSPDKPVHKIIITEKKLEPKYSYFIYPRDSQNPSLIFNPLLIVKDKYL